MSDQIRAEFEQCYPLPDGVTWAGVAYVGENADIFNLCFEAWQKSRESLVINCDSTSGRPYDYWEHGFEYRLEAWRDEQRARDEIAQRCRERGISVEREEWESER